jgi:uncharacterized membrane protein YtjA (UPF0391 family)
MLWALAFLLIAMAAAIIGFAWQATALATGAKLIFYIAIVLTAVSLIGHAMKEV